MHWVLDAAVLAAVILFAISGARKGFVKSCADFFGALIAMVGAGILSSPAAELRLKTLKKGLKSRFFFR